MWRFWSTADLKARGKTDRGISAAVKGGALLPVRPGWWAVPGTSEELVRAARVGGVATAHTAARELGLWTPPDTEALGSGSGPGRRPLLRVAVRSTSTTRRLLDPDDVAAPLGTRADVVLTWTSPTEVRESRHSGLLPVLPMLRDVFRAEDEPERALAVVDSALRFRHLCREDLPALAEILPKRLAHLPAMADGSAQSGTETIVRHRLRARGLRVEPQAELRRVGHGDLLVEGRLLIEVDGREWHDDERRFEEDRRRDAEATIGRYRVLRFSWYQVLFRWPQVEAAVFAALGR